jgi:hypothetical protein
MMSLPDRIDFAIFDDGRIIVLKMRREKAERRDVVTNNDIHLDLDLEGALDWCREHDYIVREWDGGARAWHNEIWVIRTTAQIRKKREQAERRVAALLRRSQPRLQERGQAVPNLTFLDFAYDG